MGIAAPPDGLQRLEKHGIDGVRFPDGLGAECIEEVAVACPHYSNWLQVLSPAETPQIDQGVRHQFHTVVSLLDTLKPEQQPLEFVLPRKRPLHTIP
jgi:hypothetical protein